MVKIKKQLVPSHIASKVTYGGINTKQYIVIHETANTSKGANASAHARLQANGNSRSASWQYQVDDKQIIQSFDDDAQCWHAGNRKYNEESIGIEICVNSDGDFKKAVNNAIELTKHLMNKYNISASNVIQHNKASGKNCPRYLRAGIKGVTWSQFKAKLTNTSSEPSKPSKPSTSKPKPKSNPTLRRGSKGNHVRSLQTKLVNKGYSVGKHGVDGVFGEDVENAVRSLQKDAEIAVDGIVGKDTWRILNSNFTKPKSKAKPKGDMKTGSVVDYLNSIKVDSSFNNRKKLASKYGIKGYKGTASQNATLLSKLRKDNGAKSAEKSISQMAKEVIDGKHGNGHANRRKSLGISKAKYNKVKTEVNRLASGGASKPKSQKTVKQMADEVIRGLHGSGHANRRKSLGISQSQYKKVQAEVNRRLK